MDRSLRPARKVAFSFFSPFLIVHTRDGWRELSILLMDYGISSPESLSIFYRYHIDKDFFEIKRYTALDRSGDWCPFLTWDEVKELYEVK